MLSIVPLGKVVILYIHAVLSKISPQMLLVAHTVGDYLWLITQHLSDKTLTETHQMNHYLKMSRCSLPKTIKFVT